MVISTTGSWSHSGMASCISSSSAESTEPRNIADLIYDRSLFIAPIASLARASSHPLPFPLSLFPSGHLLTSSSPTSIPCPRRSQTKVASVRVHLTRVINISSIPPLLPVTLLSSSPTAASALLIKVRLQAFVSQLLPTQLRHRLQSLFKVELATIPQNPSRRSPKTYIMSHMPTSQTFMPSEPTGVMPMPMPVAGPEFPGLPSNDEGVRMLPVCHRCQHMAWSDKFWNGTDCCTTASGCALSQLRCQRPRGLGDTRTRLWQLWNTLLLDASSLRHTSPSTSKVALQIISDIDGFPDLILPNIPEENLQVDYRAPGRSLLVYEFLWLATRTSRHTMGTITGCVR